MREPRSTTRPGRRCREPPPSRPNNGVGVDNRPIAKCNYHFVAMKPALPLQLIGVKSFMGTAARCGAAHPELLQPIANLVETRMRAIMVELGPGRAGGADSADDFVAQFDDDTTAEQHHMRELGERRDRLRGFTAGNRRRISVTFSSETCRKSR